MQNAGNWFKNAFEKAGFSVQGFKDKFTSIGNTVGSIAGKEELWQVLEKVETFLLENLKLNLNNKTVIRPTTCNIDFVGYMINKDEIRLRSATVKRMRSRIKYIVKAYERGEMTLQEVNATTQSYFSLIKHCTNEGLRENIINGFVLHCTDAARAKARESR